MTVLDDRIREHFEMAGAMPAPPLDLDAPVRRARRRRRNRIVAVAVSAILSVAGVAGVISSLVENDEGATRTVGRPAGPDAPDGPDAPVEVEPALPEVVLSMVGGSPIVSDTEVLETVVVPSTIGDLVWTVISVDPALLSTEGIVATPAGFASIGTDGQLLLSDDALEWSAFASPFPDELVELREIRAEYCPVGCYPAEIGRASCRERV